MLESGARLGKCLWYRHFLEKGDGEDLEQSVEGSFQGEALLDDGDQNINRNHDPDLRPHCIVRRAVDFLIRRCCLIHLGPDSPYQLQEDRNSRFPGQIARLALIIAEYQCDVLYRGQKEALADFLQVDTQNWIACGNALRLDWVGICRPTGTGVKLRGNDLFNTPLDQAQIHFENEGGETYICGNPPYLGFTWQTANRSQTCKQSSANA